MIKLNKNKLLKYLKQKEIQANYLSNFIDNKIGWLRLKSINIFLYKEKYVYKLGYKLNIISRILLFVLSPLTFLIYGFWKSGLKEFLILMNELKLNNIKEKDTLNKKDAEFLINIFEINRNDTFKEMDK